MLAYPAQLHTLASLLAIAQKRIVTSLSVLALPFAQPALSYAKRRGLTTKLRTGRQLIYRFDFEGFGKTTPRLSHEKSLR